MKLKTTTYTTHVLQYNNQHDATLFAEQGRIQDFKLGGGALKKIASSGGRRENFGGISCEKSRFYEKKIIFFPILGEARAGCASPWIRPCRGYIDERQQNGSKLAWGTRYSLTEIC